MQKQVGCVISAMLGRRLSPIHTKEVHSLGYIPKDLLIIITIIIVCPSP